VRALRLAALALALVAVASPAASPATSDSREARQRADWQRREQAAIHRVESTRDRYRTAVLEYQKMRHRRRIRGARKAEVLAEREAARAALEEAERLLAEFDETARRAGVPPGWLRDAPQRPPAANPAPADAP